MIEDGDVQHAGTCARSAAQQPPGALASTGSQLRPDDDAPSEVCCMCVVFECVYVCRHYVCVFARKQVCVLASVCGCAYINKYTHTHAHTHTSHTHIYVHYIYIYICIQKYIYIYIRIYIYIYICIYIYIYLYIYIDIYIYNYSKCSKTKFEISRAPRQGWSQRSQTEGMFMFYAEQECKIVYRSPTPSSRAETWLKRYETPRNQKTLKKSKHPTQQLSKTIEKTQKNQKNHRFLGDQAGDEQWGQSTNIEKTQKN